ncbi:hypothetical protein [Xylanibacter ruminicola]|uniref:Oligosaccharide repeat unit polymerase n=1 Tax=Xylanibacter ruminicola TaxID=839 RepID=A0A1M6R7F4_XYLRU|nr:hypothetical protein [Xylanibacter ruminicola]SHK28382.1 hypothetical protein SAMN05216463_101121 [Xylanibacter ruminicola]
MINFIVFFISFSLVLNSIYYDLVGIDIVISILSAILSIIYLLKIRWIDHLPSLVILLYCYLSTSFLSFSHMVPPIWTDLDLKRIAEFGNRIYFVAIFSILISNVFRERFNIGYAKWFNTYSIKDNQVRFFFRLSYALSIISYALGVSVMGAESTVLPFHLSGILHDYRTMFAPLFFMLIIENRILNKKRIPRQWYVLFIIWCLFEAFLRISKSFLVYGMMPIGLFLFLYYKPTFKKLVIYLAPFTIVALFIYAVMGTMRGATSATFSGLIEAQKMQSKSETSEEWGNPLVGSFNRMFMTGMAYRIDYNDFNHTALFDFNHSPGIFLLGGTARYRTYVLHGQQEGRYNSDGTTGIVDPLLWGGFGFCYLVISILIFIAIFTENRVKGRVGLLVSYTLLFFSFISEGTISWILSQNEFSLYVTRFVIIYLLIRLNYNYKSKRIEHKII